MARPVTPDDRPDLQADLGRMTAREGLALLRGPDLVLDWTTVPSSVTSTDGARIRFDRRRRCVEVRPSTGELWVVDLGRRDRMRTLAAVVTADLVRVEGPELEVTVRADHSMGRGDVAVRDPLDGRVPKAATSVPAGTYPTARYLDATGRTVVVAVGDLDAVGDLGTFLMEGGTRYAHLRTTSGLGCFHDGRRSGFLRAVTPDLVEQARSVGFAQVTTRQGPIGVLFDCSGPGDHLTLAAYDRDTGNTVGALVDRRRPPVRDGAIVDPTG